MGLLDFFKKSTPTPVDPEQAAMDSITITLNKLKQPARERIVFYLLAKYQIIAGFDIEDEAKLEEEEDKVEK